MRVTNMETELQYQNVVQVERFKAVPANLQNQYNSLIWHLEQLNRLTIKARNFYHDPDNYQTPISILKIFFDKLIRDPDFRKHMDNWPFNDYTMRNPFNDLLEFESYDYKKIKAVINQYSFVICQLMELFDLSSHNFDSYGQYYLTLNRYFPSDFEFEKIAGSKLYNQDGLRYLGSSY